MLVVNILNSIENGFYSFSQEISESEAVLAKNDLKLAMKRIEDLQTAINGELDSDSDSMNRFNFYSLFT